MMVRTSLDAIIVALAVVGKFSNYLLGATDYMDMGLHIRISSKRPGMISIRKLYLGRSMVNTDQVLAVARESGL